MNGGRTDRTGRQRKERFHLKDASWIWTAAATDITSKPSSQSSLRIFTCATTPTLRGRLPGAKGERKRCACSCPREGVRSTWRRITF